MGGVVACATGAGGVLLPTGAAIPDHLSGEPVRSFPSAPVFVFKLALRVVTTLLMLIVYVLLERRLPQLVTS